jgi:acyl-CoA synthetase (AMP-forming)/AMP-acid ligase II
MEGAWISDANYCPLTPISFIERSSLVYANRTSVVYGRTSYTWRQTRDRCLLLASALSQLGLARHDVVCLISLLSSFFFLSFFFSNLALRQRKTIIGHDIVNKWTK